MADEKAWYMGERAQSLAILALTDHPEVSVLPQQDADGGMSILVTVREADKTVGRFFGVDVQATLSGYVHGPTSIAPDRDRQVRFRDVPFPVCLFLFTVDNGEGYWGWIQQPILTAGQAPTLQWNGTIILKTLEPAEVNGIVRDVSRWYDDRKLYAAAHADQNTEMLV